MAKRFTATEIWEEDWFLDMPNEYKLFWFYLLSNCDHGGLFKVNVRSFCNLLGVEIVSKKALEFYNTGKKRIRVITDSLWFIEDFFVFQYGQTFNEKNRVHLSIKNLYSKHNISLTSIRGLIDHKDGVKDNDKEIDTTYIGNNTGLSPEMVKIFKTSYPFYPVDEKNDYTGCLQIAYKIATQKGWTKESVLNGNMKGVLEAWEKIVSFSTTDKWYSTRSILDFNKEFQRIVQAMVQNNKKPSTEKKEQSTAPKLSR